MSSYSFNEKSGILETKYTGVLKIEDIIGHYTRINDDDSLPRDLRVVIDCRGTKFDLKAQEIVLSYDAVRKALINYNYIKEAILVDKPHETVVAMMFEKDHSDFDSYSFRVFSTDKAARDWLLQDSWKVF
jgi:hypothetical protein